MKALDNIRLWESAIVFGFVLLAAVLSRLLIFSFRHIPMTGETGGEEALYALVGGAALAFSAPTLPLLVLYLMILFAAVKTPSELDDNHRALLVPAMLFLLAFVTAFVMAISGVPYSLASGIYKGKMVIDLMGGLLIAFYSVKTLNGSRFIKSYLYCSDRGQRERRLVLKAPILCLLAGFLFFHHLDPFYDSVFFFTGRAGAASHHPLSVSSFGLGLSAMYIALAYGASLLAASRQVAKGITWLRGTASILSLILGLSFASGTFSSLVGLIIKGH